MEHRQFGRTDMAVSVLGFGGAEIGFDEADAATTKTLINEALDAGVNVIDTAECYLASEELIGETVANRRSDYYLFTKCGHPVQMGVDDWRPESLLKSIERSLVRLRTDRVDLVQLHSCSEAELRKGDVIAALRTARDKGHTRYIGYSGDGAAAQYAVECGAFDALQISVSVADQEAIRGAIPLALNNNLGVIAKRPIGNAAWKHDDVPETAYHRPYWERFQKLKFDFQAGDVAAAVALALRFTLSVPGVHTAIVGTSKPGRVRANAAVLPAGALPVEQFNAIRRRYDEVADASWVGQT